MGPLLLLAAGVVGLAAFQVILTRFGSRYRVGRLLAVVPASTIAEARRIAEEGGRRYVRIDGRIDSDQEFEDEHHRPLVLRRTTVSWTGRRPGSISVLRAVPFVVREGLDEIGVDGQALGAGLVVVPRISAGRVADIASADPEVDVAGLGAIRRSGFPGNTSAAPDDPAELRVEHVSSVEHATVLGVPRREADGRLLIGAGMGRPLILTTLDRDEAMRILTGGAVGRSRAALAVLIVSVVLLAGAALWWLVEIFVGAGVATIVAASPDPTLRPGTDVRGGAAAGFVGEPLLAIAGVAAVGLLSLLGTLGWLRLTRERAARR